MLHIMSESRADAHTLKPFARVVDGKVVYPADDPVVLATPGYPCNVVTGDPAVIRWTSITASVRFG